ncbi:hypothetical protein CCH79_00002312 [Gambusia affinis]|uniref:UDP-glucuronosyltransferase n=1 Tax=Gambusia affinis TaxID=33528 RepID=A0A315VJG4_GAMAF|nr:hypothetical protein CCH79_00002312 [Gambusia affinis]
MTLGTFVKNFPEEVVEYIASVFPEMPQKIFFISHCDAGNILVYPLDGSHWINMEILLKELHAKGHNISVIRGSTSWYIPEKSPLYTSITVEMDGDVKDFFAEFIQYQLRVHREGSSLITFFKLTKKFMSFVSVGHTLWCDAASRILDNPKLIKSLIESQYDLVLTDPGIGPEEIVNEVASVFAEMPQKVIWKHRGKRPSTLGNNTLMMDWMPQKDLLGHPQIKVFIAHGGTNGVQEAIYFGVPVLGIPLFFDQYDNLLRLQERGAAKILQLHEVNGHSFESAVKEVLHKDSYKENIQRLSRLHQDQPMPPMDQATFWIEYVIRHKGAPHLRTEAYRMPWYSYHCLDVLLILMTSVAVVLYSYNHTVLTPNPVDITLRWGKHIGVPCGWQPLD